MTDANEALRALDEMYRRIDHIDGKLCWEAQYEIIRAHLTDPGYVRVPVVQLRKLEESRVYLWEFLDQRIGDLDKAALHGITGQIWRVANTKRWDNPMLTAAQLPAEPAQDELANLRESYRVQLSDYSAAVAARDAELAKLRERVKVLEEDKKRILERALRGDSND